MAVYHKDSPKHFASALDSLKPFVYRLDNIIIIADGPLTNELNLVINKRRKKFKIKLISLPIPQGLGCALNIGVEQSKSEFLLRMDSDDLSRPERLDILVNCLSKNPNIDVIGSYIAEFYTKPSLNDRVRKVPLTHDKIVKKTKLWSAMNHVTCLIRKQAILDVGGYQGGRGFSEDWWLWARMMKNGSKFINIKKVLVDVRVDNGFIKRRAGLKKFKEDMKLAKLMYNINFINWYHFIFILFSRLFQRLSPAILLSFSYTILRKL